MKTRFWLVLLAAILFAAGCNDTDPAPDSGSSDGGTDALASDADLTEDAAGDSDTDAQADGSSEPCGDTVCDGTLGEDCASCPADCGTCPVEWTGLSAGEGFDLEAVHCPINTAVGFAVGLEGAVLKTVDGGAHWSVLTSGTTRALRGVAFIDESTGYAVGDAGTIIKTRNGSSWASLSTPTNVALHGVDFVRATMGTVVGDDGMGAVVGDDGTILVTTDDGDSWKAQTSGTTHALHGVHFVNDKVGFAVGDTGTILKTTDGGSVWTLLNSGTTGNLHDVAFAPSGQRGLAVGEAGTILWTEDHGATWSLQSSSTMANLRAVDMALDEAHAHVVGDGGTILRTVDGGAHWQAEQSPSDSDLKGVIFPTDWTIGYAVGAGNAVVKRVPPWGDSVVYDIEAANLAPPSVATGSDPLGPLVLLSNSQGWFFTIRSGDRMAMGNPVLLDAGARSNGYNFQRVYGHPEHIFVGTESGWAYAIYAIDPRSGGLAWTADGNAAQPGIQPLGDALMAAPLFHPRGPEPPGPPVFFGTFNEVGSENRMFALSPDLGACLWVFNGDCDGGVSNLGVGRITSAPIETEGNLYFTSTSLNSGPSVWAIDASYDDGGGLVWSRSLGDSIASPATRMVFPAGVPASLWVGTVSGRLYRLRTSDGNSCWSSDEAECGDIVGDEQFYCMASDARDSTCAAGSAVVGLALPINHPHDSQVVVLTQDGHLRLIDELGLLVWKTAVPIPGASGFVIAAGSEDRVYVNSSDGSLRQLSLSTGVVTATQQVGDGRAEVGVPTYYGTGTGGMIYVNTGSGELHRFTTPFE